MAFYLKRSRENTLASPVSSSALLISSFIWSEVLFLFDADFQRMCSIAVVQVLLFTDEHGCTDVPFIKQPGHVLEGLHLCA